MRDNHPAIHFSYSDPETNTTYSQNILHAWFSNKSMLNQTINLSDKILVSVTKEGEILRVSAQSAPYNAREEHSSIAKVDIQILTKIPFKAIHVRTYGTCKIASALDLSNDSYIQASVIDCLEPIHSTHKITLVTPLDDNCSITFHKEFTSNRLVMHTPLASINATVTTNTAEFAKCDLHISKSGNLRILDADAFSNLFLKLLRCAGGMNLSNTQIVSATKAEFIDKSTANLVDCQLFLNELTVEKDAKILGQDCYIETSAKAIIEGCIFINRLKLLAYILIVDGILDGKDSLQVQVLLQAVVSGLLAAHKTEVRAQLILVAGVLANLSNPLIRTYFPNKYSTGSIAADSILQINSACTILMSAGILKASKISQATGLFVSVYGVTQAFEFENHTLVEYPYGLDLPHAPLDYSDLYNPKKVSNLLKRLALNKLVKLQALTDILSLLWIAVKASATAAHALTLAATQDAFGSGVNRQNSALAALFADSANSFTARVRSVLQKLSQLFDSNRRSQFLQHANLVDLVNILLSAKGYILLGDSLFRIGHNVPEFVHSIRNTLSISPREYVDEFFQHISSTLPDMASKKPAAVPLPAQNGFNQVQNEENTSVLEQPPIVPAAINEELPKAASTQPQSQPPAQTSQRIYTDTDRKLGPRIKIKGRHREHHTPRTAPPPPQQDARTKMDHMYTPVFQPFDFNTTLSGAKAASMPNMHSLPTVNLNSLPTQSIPNIEALKLSPDNIQQVKNAVNITPTPAMHNAPQAPLTHHVTDSRSNVFTTPAVVAPTSTPPATTISGSGLNADAIPFSNINVPNPAHSTDTYIPDITANFDPTGLAKTAQSMFAAKNAANLQPVAPQAQAAAPTVLYTSSYATGMTEYMGIPIPGAMKTDTGTPAQQSKIHLTPAEIGARAVLGMAYAFATPPYLPKMQPRKLQNAAVEMPSYLTRELRSSFDTPLSDLEKRDPYFTDWYSPAWIEDGTANSAATLHTLGKFFLGFFSGTAVNGAIFKLNQMRFVGTFVRGVGLLGAATMIVEAIGIAADFERDNLLFTEDFEHTLSNPLIPAERRQLLLEESIQRQAKARQEAEQLKSLGARFRENPAIYGFGIGSFLYIEQLSPSTCAANAFMNLRIRNPLKSVDNDRHLEFLSKVVKAPAGAEYIEVATGGAHGFENFAKARTMATIRANLGENAVPYLSIRGPHKGNVYVGMGTKDSSCLWRLDLNTRVPKDKPPIPHINWQYYDNKSETLYYGAINIDMTLDEYYQIINHFPRKLQFIGG